MLGGWCFALLLLCGVRFWISSQHHASFFSASSCVFLPTTCAQACDFNASIFGFSKILITPVDCSDRAMVRHLIATVTWVTWQPATEQTPARVAVVHCHRRAAPIELDGLTDWRFRCCVPSKRPACSLILRTSMLRLRLPSYPDCPRIFNWMFSGLLRTIPASPAVPQNQPIASMNIFLKGFTVTGMPRQSEMERSGSRKNSEITSTF